MGTSGPSQLIESTDSKIIVNFLQNEELLEEHKKSISTQAERYKICYIHIA